MEGGSSGGLKSLRRDEDEIIVSGSDDCHWFDTSSGSTRINTSLLGKRVEKRKKANSSKFPQFRVDKTRKERDSQASGDEVDKPHAIANYVVVRGKFRPGKFGSLDLSALKSQDFTQLHH